MAEEKQGFNIARITKEVERVYGIHNPNVVNTVLNEAAAPELLEALKEVLNIYSEYDFSKMAQMAAEAGNNNWWARADTAIKKATK